MKIPRLLHDYILGWSSDMRALIHGVEGGTVPFEQARECFITEDGRLLQSIYLMWTMLLRFRAYGQQTFVVGPRFRSMLENTSLTGVPWDAIKWPYPFFYVALPKCPHTLWGGPTGWHPVSGMLVGFSEGSRLTIYLWGDENSRSRAVGDDASFWFDVPLSVAAEQGDMEAYLDTLMSDPTTEWADGSDVSLNGRDAERMRQGAADPHTITLAKHALRIAINLCIYLQSAGAESEPHPDYIATTKEREALTQAASRKKSGGKQKRFQRDLNKLSRARVTWLGKSIDSATMMPASTTPSASDGPAFWVRGHWWPRLDNREAKDRHGIRWVQPYQKNKDGEPAQSRNYRVMGDGV